MAMCGQRCLGGGGVGSRAEPPSLLPVPPGPVCIHAHTHTHTHTHSAVHPAWQDYSSTQPSTSLRPCLSFFSSLLLPAGLICFSFPTSPSVRLFKLRGRRQAYPRPCPWWQRRCIHSGPGRGCEVGSLAGWSSPCHALNTHKHTQKNTHL